MASFLQMRKLMYELGDKMNDEDFRNKIKNYQCSLELFKYFPGFKNIPLEKLNQDQQELVLDWRLNNLFFSLDMCLSDIIKGYINEDYLKSAYNQRKTIKIIVQKEQQIPYEVKNFLQKVLELDKEIMEIQEELSEGISKFRKEYFSSLSFKD